MALINISNRVLGAPETIQHNIEMSISGCLDGWNGILKDLQMECEQCNKIVYILLGLHWVCDTYIFLDSSSAYWNNNVNVAWNSNVADEKVQRMEERRPSYSTHKK